MRALSQGYRDKRERQTETSMVSQNRSAPSQEYQRTSEAMVLFHVFFNGYECRSVWVYSCEWVPSEAEEGTGFPGTEFASIEKQYMLLTSELSLQAQVLKMYLFVYCCLWWWW